MKKLKKLSKYEMGAYVPPVRQRPRRSHITLPRVVIASTLVLAAFAVVMQVWSQGGGSAAAANPPSPVEKTVFTSAGKPISNDPLKVAGVEVPDPAVNLGLQPLNTGVNHAFRLRNTSSTAVTLGKANIEVLQGCCPTDPVLNATRIEPGAEVPLLFTLPMGMHAGMDGPHLFRVSVPVANENGETGKVEVYVKADFRAGASGATDHQSHTP